MPIAAPAVEATADGVQHCDETTPPTQQRVPSPPKRPPSPPPPQHAPSPPWQLEHSPPYDNATEAKTAIAAAAAGTTAQFHAAVCARRRRPCSSADSHAAIVGSLQADSWRRRLEALQALCWPKNFSPFPDRPSLTSLGGVGGDSARGGGPCGRRAMLRNWVAVAASGPGGKRRTPRPLPLASPYACHAAPAAAIASAATATVACDFGHLAGRCHGGRDTAVRAACRADAGADEERGCQANLGIE